MIQIKYTAPKEALVQELKFKVILLMRRGLLSLADIDQGGRGDGERLHGNDLLLIQLRLVA